MGFKEQLSEALREIPQDLPGEDEWGRRQILYVSIMCDCGEHIMNYVPHGDHGTFGIYCFECAEWHTISNNAAISDPEGDSRIIKGDGFKYVQV